MRVRLKNQTLAEVISRSQFSQNHWAIKLGLSKGHLADLVNGNHPFPSPETREKILRGLGVPFEDLFEIVEPHNGVDETLDLKARFQASLADRYVIDGVIGQGGMGTVYLARDVKHGRQVAIKMVLPDSIGAMGNQAFLKEIRLTASLQHPNIVTLLDSGEAAGCPYLVAPYVKDGSLRDLMREHGPFDPAGAMKIVEGICEALQYAHDHKTIHCDIKPENILVSSGRAMLTDFGISRAIHIEGHSWRAGIDTSSGTPAYVSPEQASGETAIGAKADQYSTACLLYELLSARVPFYGDNDMAVISQRFLAEPPDVSRVAPGVSWAVAEAIRKALSVDPRRRFDSMRAFQDELAHAVATGRSTLSERIDGHIGATLAKLGRTLESVLGKRLTGRVRKLKDSLLGGTQMVAHNAGGWRGMRLIGSLKQDLGYAFRSLRKKPAFAAVMVLSLALGVGVNSAMFSIVNTVLMKPLPYPDPDRLVSLSEGNTAGRSGTALAYPNFRDIVDGNTTFEAITAYGGGESSVGGGAMPVFAPTYYVAPNFFSVFGVASLLGNPRPADPAASYAVLSYGLWRTIFGSDPDIIGKSVIIDGSPLEVTAVMGGGFEYPRGAAIWVTFPIETNFGPSRTAHNLRVVGRLKSGVPYSAARAELSDAASRIAADYAGEVDQDLAFPMESLHDHVSGEYRSTLLLLGVVVGVVLLIACGNLASILMSQSLGRTREIAIRRSVGATSGRLVGQLLTESTLIGLIGGILGLMLAWFSLGMVNSVVPPEFLHSGDIALDGTVVAFTLALGTVTGILFGLLPAWRTARYSPQAALRTGDNAFPGRPAGRRTGGALVVPQYAFSLTALVAAGLVVKSLITLVSVDPGFPADGLVTVELSLPTRPPSPYAEREAIRSFHSELLRRIEAIPGVAGVTLDNAPSLFQGGFRVNGAAGLEGMAENEWTLYPDWRVVGAGFFATMGTRLIAGRDILDSDASGDPVVVVNESFARQAWGEGEAIGRLIRLSSLDNNGPEARRWLRVVGVAPDFHSRGLDEEVRPAIFAPVHQHMDRAGGADLVARVTGDPRTVLDAMREAIRAVDPGLPVGRSETIATWVKEATAEPRFRAGLLLGLASLALALALLGVYGVMSHSVARRRKEIAVRLALGSEKSGIVMLLTREGLWFVFLGQLLGSLLAFLVTRLMSGMLFGVTAFDPVVYLSVSLLLASVVILTTLVPAFRAGRVRPAEVLKE